MEEKIEKKTKLTAGADERTPSHSQYFSWINNTNEGSTEAQTLINLAYFGYLHDKYNMDLDIYAWDAGNLDGAGGTYEGAESAKNKAQYPNGYAPIAEAAKKIGTRLGVWCGPDGFGDTPEQAAARHELMVSLCRDYHFAEFKIDGVCGQLRPEKRENFVRMMKECRKYSPDLVLLNHRLELGIGNPYATTFLWNGQETYVDVFVGNKITAPHNRSYLFFRGNVPELQRLSEDHGVCISSCVDYFEDDLIYQAFGRCLILAPEIYGNPWLMRDDEQAHLARIYNLHRTYRDILVDGILLPEQYGPSSVSRGNGKTQFITTGNPSWSRGKVTLNLNREIGLERCGKVMVSTHHPYEKLVGIFEYGDRVDVEIPAFRACLIEVSAVECARPMLTGCEYEVLHEERDGRIDRVKVICKFGDVKLTDGVTESAAPAELVSAAEFDNTIAEPIVIGHAEACDVPENAEQLFETATFTMNMDSLESRELARSGETAIPEVKAARDAFFNQKTYLLRGCESRFAFDGNEDTYFDGISRQFFSGFRMDGGCLRVDFGREYDADYIMLEYFDIDDGQEDLSIEPEEGSIMKRQVLTGKGDVSSDLAEWRDVTIEDLRIVRHETIDVLIHSIHNIVKRNGTRRQVFYGAGKGVRYFRLPRPIDHIYKIVLIKDGHEIELESPHVNNLLPSYRDRNPVISAQEATVTVKAEDWREDCYIAVALNGEYGRECAYAVAEIDGKLVGFPRRAPSYASNVWECWAVFASTAYMNYTYYLPVSRDMIGKEIKIHTIFNSDKECDVSTDIYLCDANNEKHGITVEL